MKVKILMPIAGMAYFGNETAELPEPIAARLVAKGQAVIIPETVTEPEKQDGEPESSIKVHTAVITGNEVKKRGRKSK